MAIPEDWLVGLTDPVEVEQELAGESLPDLWLRQWRAFADRFLPGDELWEYWGYEAAPLEVDLSRYHVGFALIREGEVFDSIETPWLT